MEGQREEIELVFTRFALPKIYDHFTEEEIRVEDEIIKVQAFRALTPSFFDLLLSFGYQVKVVSPSHLQNLLVSTLKKIFSNMTTCSHISFCILLSGQNIS